MQLHDRWMDLKRTQPGVRTRDAARALDVSEAELAASKPGARRLLPDCPRILGGLRQVGPVLALTRNEVAVHERAGRYEEVSVEPGAHVGGVYGPDIDLRIFPAHWAYALSTEVDTRHGPRRSIQVFDAAGDAVHKVYVTDDTDRAAWDALVEGLADADAGPVAVDRAPTPARAPATPDRDAVLADWAAMQDTHDFFLLLRKHRLGRREALELAEGRFTERLPLAAPGALLEAVAEAETPIMAFVGSRGCIQIHSGPVHRVKAVGGWLNVLDPRFNLHIREELVREVWIVRKPTADGDVTSVELLDETGEAAVLFFGVRKPGIEEDPAWRKAVAGLPR